MKTIIQSCNCPNSYQDEKYGAGKRVYNVGGGKKATSAACTTCGSKKDMPNSGGSDKKDDEKKGKAKK